MHKGVNAEPLGDQPLNRVAQAQRLDEHNAEKLEQVEAEVIGVEESHGTAAGDSRKLRGVPVQARKVGGAIAGTIPGSDEHLDALQALLDNYHREVPPSRSWTP
jgi:hypothetical protein